MYWRIGTAAQVPAAEALQGSRPAMTAKEGALELQKLLERARLGLESVCWYQSPQARR